METGEIIAALSLVLAIIGAFGAAMAFILNRTKQVDDRCRDNIAAVYRRVESVEVDAHERIDRLRDNTMQRTELNRLFEHIETGITGMNTRIDALTNALIAGKKIGSGDD